MIRVKLSTNFPDWPVIRQTPGRSGVWGDCRFFVNEDIDECDFWVVYDDVLRSETTRCPARNTLLITGEPPSVKTYSRRFLSQFGTVLTSHRNLTHPHIINRQQGLPWMVGCRYLQKSGQWDTNYTKDYDELSALPIVPKTKLLSVISSSKTITPGHKRRLDFVEALKQRFGAQIDVFGRGIRDVEDKWDAIAPYRYHVVIENGQFPDYWTEKLSDTFLAGAYPFYDGCPNIGDYFSGGALTRLDTSNFEAAIAQIEVGMKESRFEATVTERQQASQMLLDEYNLFPVLAKWACAGNAAPVKQAVSVQPQSKYQRALMAKIKGKARQIWSKAL